MKITLNELKAKCETIAGIKSLRKARLKDGIHIKFKTIFENCNIYDFTTFVHLDGWENSLRMCKGEYERFYIKKQTVEQ